MSTTRHAARMSRVHLTAIGPDGTTERDDLVAGEEPLQVLAAGPGQEPIEVAVTMRTPGHEDELAVGFLVSEGLAASGDIDRHERRRPGPRCPAGRPRRRPPAARSFDAGDGCRAADASRPPAAGSAARRASMTSLRRCDPLPDGSARRLRTSSRHSPGQPPERRRRRSSATGGLHAAGLFDTHGEPDR